MENGRPGSGRDAAYDRLREASRPSIPSVRLWTGEAKRRLATGASDDERSAEWNSGVEPMGERTATSSYGTTDPKMTDKRVSEGVDRLKIRLQKYRHTRASRRDGSGRTAEEEL